ncbi:hypothetical protein NIES3974_13600 [Calothrix sp. NIES-3974]|nr:hypothetical protein NIES3974_13600 [Calothrix sp. NIES-3974]
MLRLSHFLLTSKFYFLLNYCYLITYFLNKASSASLSVFTFIICFSYNLLLEYEA